MHWSSEGLCSLKSFHSYSWGLASWSPPRLVLQDPGWVLPQCILAGAGAMFCSLGESWEHGYGRPWSKQDPHSEIISQGFCYLVTAPVATSYRACSEPMQLIQESVDGLNLHEERPCSSSLDAETSSLCLPSMTQNPCFVPTWLREVETPGPVLVEIWCW